YHPDQGKHVQTAVRGAQNPTLHPTKRVGNWLGASDPWEHLSWSLARKSSLTCGLSLRKLQRTLRPVLADLGRGALPPEPGPPATDNEIHALGTALREEVIEL
ncbi:MAG: hypothetical protein KJN63_10155, partial [Acidimicrobiia bacterium]|nr:hypothetical protein [Acidimicrobiia bacterium]